MYQHANFCCEEIILMAWADKFLLNSFVGTSKKILAKKDNLNGTSRFALRRKNFDGAYRKKKICEEEIILLAPADTFTWRRNNFEARVSADRFLLRRNKFDASSFFVFRGVHCTGKHTCMLYCESYMHIIVLLEKNQACYTAIKEQNKKHPHSCFTVLLKLHACFLPQNCENYTFATL